MLWLILLTKNPYSNKIVKIFYFIQNGASNCFISLSSKVPMVCLRFILVCVFLTGVYCYAQEHKIVAVVENEPITTLDLKNRINLFYFLHNIEASKISSSQELLLRNEALKSLIKALIVTNKASSEHIEINDASVSAALEAFATQEGSDIVTFHKKLRKLGIAPEDIKAFIKEDITKQMLLEKAAQKVEVSRMELASYLKILQESLKNNRDNDVVKLAEIRVPISQKQEAKLVMERVLASISDGMSFENLLLAYGVSTKNNGEIGWVQLKQLNKHLSSVLSKTSIGSIAGPILLDDAIIIIRVLDRKPSTDFVQDGYEKLIDSYLLTIKKNQKMSEYWTELFKSSCVQILIP